MRVYPKFVISAFAPEQFPAPSVPEIAFLGRSNVGKSSLINALLGSKQANVSATPGRTRSINFFALLRPPNAAAAVPLRRPARLRLRKNLEIHLSRMAKFIDPYLAERGPLALCICLVDSNIPMQRSDQQLIDYLRSVGRPFLVVGTKADRLSGNTRVKAQQSLKRDLNVDELLLVSAETGLGMNDLWAAIRAAAQII